MCFFDLHGVLGVEEQWVMGWELWSFGSARQAACVCLISIVCVLLKQNKAVGR